MTTQPNDHHTHAHLDGGRCLDGSGRTWEREPVPTGLGPAHDVTRCSVCRGGVEVRHVGLGRALVDAALVLALACLLVLLLAAWFLY